MHSGAVRYQMGRSGFEQIFWNYAWVESGQLLVKMQQKINKIPLIDSDDDDDWLIDETYMYVYVLLVLKQPTVENS